MLAIPRELGAHNICVNRTAPGFVRSNPASEAQGHAMGEAGQKVLLDSIALRRGTPDDIARAVRFFCSNYAAWITRADISVDGGHWMRSNVVDTNATLMKALPLAQEKLLAA